MKSHSQAFMILLDISDITAEIFGRLRTDHLKHAFELIRKAQRRPIEKTIPMERVESAGRALLGVLDRIAQNHSKI